MAAIQLAPKGETTIAASMARSACNPPITSLTALPQCGIRPPEACCSPKVRRARVHPHPCFYSDDETIGCADAVYGMLDGGGFGRHGLE